MLGAIDTPRILIEPVLRRMKMLWKKIAYPWIHITCKYITCLCPELKIRVHWKICYTNYFSQTFKLTKPLLTKPLSTKITTRSSIGMQCRRFHGYFQKLWVVLLRSNTMRKTGKVFIIGQIGLKLVSAIFYQNFIFSANDSPRKAMTKVFYFIWKALFVLEIINFCNFFPSFRHSPDTKG